MRKTDLAYRSELNPLIKPQDLARSEEHTSELQSHA